MTAARGTGTLALHPSTDAHLWDTLVAKHPDATPFHRADLLTVMGEVLGREVHLLVAEIDGVVVGVVPLLVRARGPLVEVNRGLPVPYVGPLLEPGCSLTDVLAAVRQYLRPRVVSHFGLQSLTPFTVPGTAGWSYDGGYSSAFAPVPDTDDEGLAQVFSKGQRRQLRRSLERGLLAGDATRDEVAEHLTAWANAPFVRQGLPPRWPDGAHLAVYDALPSDVRFGTAVRCDGEVLAIGVSLCSAGRMVGWEIGMSDAGRAAGAATVLHVREVGLARDRGIRELDILGAPSAGLASYKQSLGAVFRPRGVASWEPPLLTGLRRAAALVPTRAAR